jgi:thioredoxin-like negative regulator of GroEL
MNARPAERARARQAATPDERPRLIVFHSPTSGRSRRVEGYLAQVLQRRHNHETFVTHRVSADERPDLLQRFHVVEIPTVCVVEGRRVVARVVSPRGCSELERALLPWLR